MFRALQYPSSGARQTAFAASGFRMNVEVEVFSADHGRSPTEILGSNLTGGIDICLF
jgi:hypothetical protein